MEATDPSLQHIPVALRNLQHGSLHALNHASDSMASQLAHSFDPTDPSPYQSYATIGGAHVGGGQLQSNNVYNVQQHNPQNGGLQDAHPNGQMRGPLRQTDSSGFNAGNNAPYGLLTAEQHLAAQPLHSSLGSLQHESNSFLESADQVQRDVGSHFRGLKLIENPPNLQEWREKLFNVDDTITLTEQEFQTYFPHVDNVYSHRSTQKYKRKPFVSHYWDCRLKGRPPGTPKSDDPSKKKRKRTARERDLCDVKIKITEYFPGSTIGSDFNNGVDGLSVDLSASNFFDTQGSVNGAPSAGEAHSFGVLQPSANLPVGHPGAGGAKYFTIQRVNGNNGKDDNTPCGGHRHTLEESDRVKKNSVQRWLLKEAKETKKKSSNTNSHPTSQATPTSRTQTKKPSGFAAVTAKRHSKEADLKLFGSFTCPFTQRIWIALEIKQIPYQYVEVDVTLKRPEELLECSPKGKIPAIKHGNWGTFDSMVIMEYLEDLSIGHALLPLGDPQLRAHCRQWVDHINRNIMPAFYTLLNSADSSTYASLTTDLQDHITQLVNASHVTGPFFLGNQISYVDVAFAPWVLRLSRVLKYYRGWPDPEVGSRWQIWVDAVEQDERVRCTLSEETAYRDRHEDAAEKTGGGMVSSEMKAAMYMNGQTPIGSGRY